MDETEEFRAEAALRPLVEEVVAWGADTLVLGCTHYPLLRPALERVSAGRLSVVDSAQTTAERVERTAHALLDQPHGRRRAKAVMQDERRPEGHAVKNARR